MPHCGSMKRNGGKTKSMKRKSSKGSKYMSGGSCASDHVNNALTGGCWTCGGKKTMKKRGTKRSMKRVISGKKKTMKRKMRGGANKKHNMNGGGVLDIQNGCGFVNTADLNRHGCNPDEVRNPPNLGLAGSGVNELGMPN